MVNDQMVNIVRTAGELFFRLGIRSVSIDDICRELGMSKKTFYVFFESKDALIEQMLQAKFLKHQEVEKNDVRRVPQLVYDLKKYYPRQFADFQAKCFEMQKDYIKQYIELGVAQGLVRANLNIELAAVLFAKIHNDAIRDFEEIEKNNHNLHQLAHTAMDVFVRGILSEEGLKLYNEKS